MLEEDLQKYSKSGRNLFVVTERLFSMDGDYPELTRIADLEKKYNFSWIVDEAHGVGWYGLQGSGICGKQNVLPFVDILVGTLGKAMASQGAFVMFCNSWKKIMLLTPVKTLCIQPV